MGSPSGLPISDCGLPVIDIERVNVHLNWTGYRSICEMGINLEVRHDQAIRLPVSIGDDRPGTASSSTSVTSEVLHIAVQSYLIEGNRAAHPVRFDLDMMPDARREPTSGIGLITAALSCCLPASHLPEACVEIALMRHDVEV